jgi:uncharacterized phiE125 gp8 family phage protein
MIYYSRVTDSASDMPVSLAEAKAHLRIVSDSEDSLIGALITAAVSMCEAYAGLSFATCERTVKMDRFPCGDIILPYGPVQEIISFSYTDSDGTETPITGYSVDKDSGITRLRAVDGFTRTTWPMAGSVPNSVKVVYQAGYDDVSGVPLPPQVKSAILMQIATLYENRQSEVVGQVGHVLNFSTEYILDTVKVYWSAEYQ